MKTPKVLAVASAIDLDFRYGCTPAWWQLWKGMYEAGVDLVVPPCRGRAVESPWWRTAPNPTYRQGEAYAAARGALARLKGDRYLRRAEESPEDSSLDRLTRVAIWRAVTPRWRRHLERLPQAPRPHRGAGFPGGGLERLRELGARRAEAIFWGADPEFFRPRPVGKTMDVFFYGYGDKFRRDWMGAMGGAPSP